jgi:hypothetical protein
MTIDKRVISIAEPRLLEVVMNLGLYFEARYGT